MWMRAVRASSSGSALAVYTDVKDALVGRRRRDGGDGQPLSGDEDAVKRHRLDQRLLPDWGPVAAINLASSRIVLNTIQVSARHPVR